MKGVLPIAVALVLAGFVPLAGAYHLSVGSQDAVLVQPTESPDDPSVTASDFERGTSTDCYEPAAGDSPDQALGTDAFCGRLVYNEGTSYEQESSPDQDLYGPVGTFDVVYASYVGNYGLSTNLGWADARQAYELIHDTGADAGLTDNGATAWAGDQGWQQYAQNILYPNALITAQQNTGLWEMNGWAHSIHDQQFIGFLLDENGDPIDDDRLADIVAEHSGDLPSDAPAQVCGFTEDKEVTISAPQSTFCEVLFLWTEEEQDPTTVGGDYQDPCSSPAYICGSITPAWYAQLVCKTFFSLGGIQAGSFGCGGGDYPSGGDGPAWSDNDYDVWHWVVAPSQSRCGGLAEPGFSFGSGTTMPYLAHDVDVYSPAATAAGEQGTENVEGIVRAELETVTDQIPGVDTSGADPADLAPQLVKRDQPEPNAEGDTSQTISLSRDFDPCQTLRPTPEEHTDPWVNIIDNEVTFDAAGEPAGDGFDLYLNEDPDQDASNRPGIAMYFTQGKVGMFSDFNDDGDYDQAPSASLFQDIYSVGAYPMYWDMWLNQTEEGELVIGDDLGCAPGFTDDKLSQALKEGGYGIHTGLIQVVYLSEPTVLWHWGLNSAFPYTEGDTAFVFMSQGLHQLRAENDPVVMGAIQDAIGAIPGADMSDVVYPIDEAGTQSDWGDQCAEATGGFTSEWGFVHNTALGVAGDTVVTKALFEVDDVDGELGGDGSGIPVFSPGDEAYGFADDQLVWTDVDPLDGDPSRNTGNGAPPH